MLRRLLGLLLALFAFTAVGEAADQKKPVHHRPRHSTRVSANSPTATTGTTTTKKKTTKPAAAAASTSAKPRPKTTKKTPPSTKPR